MIPGSEIIEFPTWVVDYGAVLLALSARETKFSRTVGRILSGQFNVLWYALQTRLRGLDLSGASPESLGLNPAEAVQHSNSGGPILDAVLQACSIPPGSRIIDFGSGKGGAVFTMARFPFTEVLGIELSPELVSIAKRNAQSLNVSNVHFECRSATEVTVDLDRFSHIYFFNPFSPAIFRQVYQNLVDSLKRKPRMLTVICKHPEGSIEQCFPESEAFRLMSKMQFTLSHPFYVFRSTHDC